MTGRGQNCPSSINGEEQPSFDPSQVPAQNRPITQKAPTPHRGLAGARLGRAIFVSEQRTRRRVQAGCPPAMRTIGMKRKLNDDATMDAIMSETPAAIRVLLRYGMLCVGCPIAPFHTVSEAAREHDLDENQLRRDLEAAADTDDGTSSLPRGLRRSQRADGARRRRPSAVRS